MVVSMSQKKKERRREGKILLLSVFPNGSSQYNWILRYFLAAEENYPDDEDGGNEDGIVGYVCHEST